LHLVGYLLTVINYFIANRKLSKLVLDVRVYNGSDIGSDHFLTLDKLRFSPKKIYLIITFDD